MLYFAVVCFENLYLLLDSSMSLLHVPLLPGGVENKLSVLLKKTDSSVLFIK